MAPRLEQHPAPAPTTRQRSGRLALTALLISTLVGCASLTDAARYYWQAAGGQIDLLWRARPVDDWLADPGTAPALRQQLMEARAIRAWASSELALPDNRSYRNYVELAGPFVSWSVTAAPEFSLTLKTWCFPIVGCVGYRGYFAEGDAQALAGALRAEGLEASVHGIPAYSTLGWFNDPLLSSFMRQGRLEVARLVFHELSHQKLFIPGDTTFNESWATAVEQLGVERWLKSLNPDDAASLAREWTTRTARRADFLSLVEGTRAELEALYRQQGTLDTVTMRARKAAILEALQARYRTLRDGAWQGFRGYDGWFARPPGNADFGLTSAYTRYVPAFRAIFEHEGESFAGFYAAVRTLADQPLAERTRQLDGWLSAARPAASTPARPSARPG